MARRRRRARCGTEALKTERGRLWAGVSLVWAEARRLEGSCEGGTEREIGRRRGSRLQGRDGVGHQSEIERRRRSSEGLLAAEGERWDRGSLGLVRQRPAGPWATSGTGLLEAQMARLARLLSSLLILLFTKTENNKRKEKRKENVRGRI